MTKKISLNHKGGGSSISISPITPYLNNLQHSQICVSRVFPHPQTPRGLNPHPPWGIDFEKPQGGEF